MNRSWNLRDTYLWNNSIHQKRERFGIKFDKLCESDSGYCYDFKIHTGLDKINRSDSTSESVAKELSQLVLHRGYTLYLHR